jgi:predicted kinase
MMVGMHRPQIYLLCGRTGSGKTTHAKRIESSGAIRFSLDEWMIRFYGHHMSREAFDARVRVCEEMIFELARAFASRNIDVVIDHGFWTRQSRNWAREQLAESGVEVRLLYLDASDAELLSRLERRNSALPLGTFVITEEMFEMFSSSFEPPAADEAHTIVHLEPTEP